MHLDKIHRNLLLELHCVFAIEFHPIHRLQNNYSRRTTENSLLDIVLCVVVVVSSQLLIDPKSQTRESEKNKGILATWCQSSDTKAENKQIKENAAWVCLRISSHNFKGQAKNQEETMQSFAYIWAFFRSYNQS